MSTATLANQPGDAAALLDDYRQTGRPAAFEELVRRYAGMVFHVCLDITRHREDAEDATQAVFLALAVHCKDEQIIRSPGAWLRQVAQRVALDSRRSSKRRRRREETYAAALDLDGPDAAEQAGAEDLKRLVTEELQHLPSKYRLPLILHYFGGQDSDEIARELKLRPGTLRVGLFRGREMLAKRLAARGIVVGTGLLAVALARAVQSCVSDSLVASITRAAADLTLSPAARPGLALHAGGWSAANGLMASLLGSKLKLASALLALAGIALSAGATAYAALRPALNLPWVPSLQFDGAIRRLLPSSVNPLRVDAAPAPAEQPPLALAPLDAPFLDDGGPWQLDWPSMSAPPHPTFPDAERSAPAPRPPAVAANPASARAAFPAARPLPQPPARRDLWQPAGPSRSLASATLPPRHHAGHPAAVPAPYVGPSTPAPNPVVPPITSLPPASPVMTPPPIDDIITLGPIASAAAHPARTGSSGSGGSTPRIPSPDASPVTLPGQPTYSITPHTLRGHGQPPPNTALAMGGQVVADGHGHDRTLDLTELASLTYPHENPADGPNGFYAVDRGKLLLPPTPVPADGASLTWGDDPADPTPDLVNSFKIDITGPDLPPTITFALVATGRSDVPKLPADVRLPSLWTTEGGLAVSGSLLARYDAGAAVLLNLRESDLTLWLYDGQWRNAGRSFLDTDLNLIAGDLRFASWFGVGAASTPLGTASADVLTARPSLSIAPRATPEPGTAFLTVVGLSALLARRRRRQPERTLSS